MTLDTDQKIQLAIVIASAAAFVAASILAAHGFAIPLLDEIGGGPH